mgnify:CR=1 FL=1
MSFPPEFSSTATYSNKYDLDEIDVFLEGDSFNPMYFNIEGLNKQFAFGKHYFNLSILDSKNQQHQLRPGSRILFEFKSINNVVLRSDVAKVNQRNGLITGFFEILKDPLRTYKEVQDGEGILTVVASLQNKSSTLEENLIPEKFIGAMNYRCMFPINIRKNGINADSPSITNITHKNATIAGMFSFSNNSTPATDDSGAEYDNSGNRTNGINRQALGTTQ